MAQSKVIKKPDLYLHVHGATHFLQWEVPEFEKYFNLVDKPSDNTPLLVFGPDALEAAAQLPASKRFAVLFPGYGFNPLHNETLRNEQKQLFVKYFELIFINPGPLEIAYKEVKNTCLYPFSVDTRHVKIKRYRTRIESLIHVSNESPQKDWERSEAVMRHTGLRYEVYPPRDSDFYNRQHKINESKNKLRKLVGIPPREYLPKGYVPHEKVIKKYQQYDGFVHVASDIRHPVYVDGKYTASLIEAGLTGAILFWHDTLGLGNTLKTVFELPLDPESAAKEILRIVRTINVEEHSKATREEMLRVFNPENSVKIRADAILKHLKSS